MPSEMREKCGVVGVRSFKIHPDAPLLALRAGLKVQHRGQDSNGKAWVSGDGIEFRHQPGRIEETFHQELEYVRGISSPIASLHARYRTSGGDNHPQPVVINDEFALSHNGNIPYPERILSELTRRRIDVGKMNDSEMLARLIYSNYKKGAKLWEAVKEGMEIVEGAATVVVQSRDTLIMAKDIHGVRPGVFGYSVDDNGRPDYQTYAVASETVALDKIGVKPMRELFAGELVEINEHGHNFIRYTPNVLDFAGKLDFFEIIYNMNKHSLVNGRPVEGYRGELGIELAKIDNIDADVVVPVPNTSIPAAKAYAKERGLPIDLEAIKKKDKERTFILPPDIRAQRAMTKYEFNRERIRGKRLIVVDDSIVRGLTSQILVWKLIREYGASSVDLRIPCPPITSPDLMGNDISTFRELFAVGKSEDQMAKELGARSVLFLPVKNTKEVFGDGFSFRVVDGRYPYDNIQQVVDEMKIRELDRRELAFA